MTLRIAPLICVFAFLLWAEPLFAGIHSGTVTLSVSPQVDKTSKVVKLWVPYPLSSKYQTISAMQVEGNYARSAVYREPASESTYLYAEWAQVPEVPLLTMRFHVTLESRAVESVKSTGSAIPVPIQKYLQSTQWVPADAYRKEAAKIIKGKSDILSKARAVYEWTIENTFRDPKVKACGLGIPGRTLNQCAGGGKCADISAVFVTMARAAGVPARDIYGLRLATPKSGNITSGYHCWAEFYLPGTGWVPVDPADVRKMMLVHNLELKDATDWKTFFWGGDDLFRVVLSKGARGVSFNPTQTGAPLNYFMYPYAEADGKVIDYFDAEKFSYTVHYIQDDPAK